MRKRWYFLSIVIFTLLGISCNDEQSLRVEVGNPLSVNRTEEMVEIPLHTIQEKGLVITDEFLIKECGVDTFIPCQVTYDKKLVFPVILKASATNTYIVSNGTMAENKDYVKGRQYPEREDDIAWENDKVGFRIYGPPLQRRGEKAYGYDLFLKRVNRLVLEEIYAKELDPTSWKLVNELRDQGKNYEADSLIQTFSYHVDHGLGMDCYAVGPTLGAGTAALIQPDSSVAYPYCYKEYEILDNGPLRFTVKLVFHPMDIGCNKGVVETRLIQLDRGSHLNKTTLDYEYLSEPSPLVTGIVVHESNPDAYQGNARNGYMSYIDKTIKPDGDNGLIFIGTVLPEGYEQIKYYPQEEMINGVSGHWMGYTTYHPDAPFVYYWGFGWNKYGFKNVDEWNDYLEYYANQIRHPLNVTIK